MAARVNERDHLFAKLKFGNMDREVNSKQ